MFWIRAEVAFIIGFRDLERAGEFTRTGAKLPLAFNSASRPHDIQPGSRPQGADENESVGIAFHEHVQHPVNAVIQVDVCGAGYVPLDEGADARPEERVARLVILREVRFGLDDDARAWTPDEFRSDQLTRADQRIALKERRWDHAPE
jgi:hypothetical protein